MAYDVLKVASAGAESVYYGAVDSSGYLIGSTGTAPTAGNQDGSAMIQLEGVKNFPFVPNAPDRLNITGDDGAIAQFLFNPIELPTGDTTFAVSDQTFAALAMSTLVHDIGGYKFLGLQPSSVTYQDLCMLVTARAVSRTTGSVGSTGYYNYLIMKANASYQGRDAFSERAEAAFIYNLIANKATCYPTGLAFSDANNGDTEFVVMEFTSYYRPMFQRWTGNNTETTFNLAKNIADDAANNIAVYVAGVAQTWVTGAPGAGEFGITEGATDTLVLGTAPASAAKMVALYGWS